MSDLGNKFAKNLRTAREKKKKENPKWTQGYVAEKIGVARSTYTAYEGCTKQPPLETVTKLADLLEVSVDHLLGRTDKPTVDLKPESDKESLFFFDQENITPEEAEELKKHLEFLRYKARQENEK